MFVQIVAQAAVHDLLTFVRCAYYALHDRLPVHHIVAFGTKLDKRIIGIVLVCLYFSHEPLER